MISTKNNTHTFAYILAIMLMFASIAVSYWSYPDVFSILRVITGLVLIAIILFFGNKKLRLYCSCIMASIIVVVLGEYMNTELYHSNAFRMGYKCISMILISRALLSFQGLTIKMRHLALIAGICLIGLLPILDRVGSDMFVMIPYVLALIFMCWQGINLYFIKRTSVYIILMIFVLITLLYNIIGGLNFYIFKSDILRLSTWMLHWITWLLLVHTTTLSRAKFESVKRGKLRFN